MSLHSKEVARFGTFDIEITGPDGEKWAVANHVGIALGYTRLRSFRKLIADMDSRGELKEGGHFKYLPLETSGGEQLTLVLSHRGVIRVTMRADAPNAVPFRDWAEDVLFKVMTTGSYVGPRIAQTPAPTIEQTCAAVVTAIVPIFEQMIEKRFNQVYIPAQPDNSSWPTPTQRIKVLVSKDKIPKRFNIAGTFDGFVSLRHANIRGGLLTQRDRRMAAKMPEYVICPCPENDQFLREAFAEHLKSGSITQQRLKLVPMKSKPEQARRTPSKQ